MFVTILTYVKPLSEVEKHLSGHVDFLNQYFTSGHFICAGAKVPRDGGVILCNAPSKQEALEIMKQDPFYVNGVADYQVIEFTASRSVEGFKQFVK